MNFDLFQKRITSNVEDNDGCIWIFNIRGNKWMKSLLTSCIPKLHSKTFMLNTNCFWYEINSYCRLIINVITCSFPVKLSKIKRFIIDVLPTDWSPKRTILHLTACVPYIIFKKLYLFWGFNHKTNTNNILIKYSFSLSLSGNNVIISLIIENITNY